MCFRMLTRLTPRGTSSATFVRNARKIPMESGRSLRGREVSISSEEEEEEEDEDEDEDDEDEEKDVASKRNTRKNVRSKGDASDADEESSSRDSSVKPKKDKKGLRRKVRENALY